MAEFAPMYNYWMSFILGVKGEVQVGAGALTDEQKNAIEKAIDATITMIFSMSSMGIHDVQTTNELCEVVDGYNKRVAAMIDKMSDKQKEEADAADWMQRQETLEQMEAEVNAENTEE